jgi:hypothetical protein
VNQSRRTDTLSHVYGIAGLVPGVLGLWVALKSDAPWSEYALFAAGWLTATVFALMLIRAFNRARDDGEIIGGLNTTIQALEKELSARNATLDFVAGLHMGKTAAPRSDPGVAQTPITQPGPAAGAGNASTTGTST